MKYVNANDILPDMLIEELQKYVQAGYIYIPVKNEQHKSWGELSFYQETCGQILSFDICYKKNNISEIIGEGCRINGSSLLY